LSAKSRRTPRKFARSKLKRSLAPEISESIVRETKLLLDRRFQKLAVDFDDISATNFNPLLLLITAPVYNLSSPFEVAERLQLGKAFHGDDTAFGRFGEEKLLPLFGAEEVAEKRGASPLWEPIDRQIVIDGTRYLLSIKAGPWTMNQAHANAMIANFPKIHSASHCPILLGILYGRYDQLNNKPELVQNRLGSPKWFDYLVGRDFWEFVSGVREVHRKLFVAIRKAQNVFAEEHGDETFHERLVANRIKIATSLRKKFNVADEEDFWWTLFNNMF